MTQTTLTRIRGKFYAYSFTTGVKPAVPKARKDQKTALAELNRLLREGRDEEAESFFEQCCNWLCPTR
jgi:hypothetical protein